MTSEAEYAQARKALIEDIARQEVELAKLGTSQPVASGDAQEVVDQWWTPQNAMTMSSIVLLFGFIVIVICAWLMRESRPTAESVLRVFGTVLIITGALFLVVAGYDDKQMAPVMGLLGTLAGYLLGKNPSGAESRIGTRRDG